MDVSRALRVAATLAIGVATAVGVAPSWASAAVGKPSPHTIPHSGITMAAQLNTTNEEAAFDYFVAHGLTNEQAAGIVGNLDQESGVDPTAQQLNGPGRGIAQWSVGSRWDTNVNDNVLWYANQQSVSAYSLNLQLAFTWYELKNFPSYGLQQVESAQTIDAATIAFQDNFEMCGACDTSYREQFAHDAYDKYAGSTASSGGSAVLAGSSYHVFWTGDGGHMMQSWYDTAAPGWHTQDLGGVLSGAAAATYHDGRYDVFAVSPGGGLYEDTYTSSSSWSGWRLIATGWVPGVSAVFDGANYHVFGHDSNGHLLQAWTDNGWHVQDLGGISVGTPATTYHDGIIDVFSVSPGGALYQRTYNSTWGDWHMVPGGGTYGDLGAAAVWTGTSNYVFTLNPGAHLYEQYYDGAWHGPLSLGGTFSGSVGVTYNAGRFDLFGPAGGGMYQQTYYPGSGWNGWHQFQ